MGRASALKKQRKHDPKPLKLDFGCGSNKREGFLGVDRLKFDAVDIVHDLTQLPWPWADESVTEAHASHMVEHLTAMDRIAFVNELHRVLVPGGTCQIITPHWASSRAYGDPTHQWPPISEFWFLYLSRTWRLGGKGANGETIPPNAPHTDVQHLKGGFDCDFDSTMGYNIRADLTGGRSQEYQTFAIQHYKEVINDIHATLTKRSKP